MDQPNTKPKTADEWKTDLVRVDAQLDCLNHNILTLEAERKHLRETRDYILKRIANYGK